jgi:putative membrane protein
MKFKKHDLLLFLLIVFYTVGIVGLSMDSYRELFLTLTPFNLLLTLALIKWMDRDFSTKGMLAFILVFVIGYGVEVAGVHTGVLFGEYTYGSPLGWKAFDVPLLIGVNWFILAYATAGVSAYLWKNWILKIGFAALLMVCLDFFIEPVAVDLDFWRWAGGLIPLQNYLMWFITALVVQFVLWRVGSKIDKKTGLYVFLIQLYFFMALNLI